MTCTKCGEKTKVVDTRAVPNGTKRRLECLGCGHRFNTIETTIDIYDELIGISKDVKREFSDALDKHIADLYKIKESFYYIRER